ncbi:MAG: tetratricopeptide repeat protein [Planctomycetes bacterium]|nr:tetratricopeptide repeat protein [Planctomycetota bacterium]
MDFYVAVGAASALNLGIGWAVRSDLHLGRLSCGRSVYVHAGFALLALAGIGMVTVAAFGPSQTSGLAERGMLAAGSLMVVFSALAIPGLCLVPFVTFLVGEYAHRGARFLMSEDQVRVAKTYDQAEACERQRDWEGALAAYRRALAEDIEDWEARRRMAEVHLKTGDVGAAVAGLRLVAERIAEPGRKAAVTFRLAELLAGPQRDRAGARALLVALAAAVAGTQVAPYVKLRIAALDEESAE